MLPSRSSTPRCPRRGTSTTACPFQCHPTTFWIYSDVKMIPSTLYCSLIPSAHGETSWHFSSVSALSSFLHLFFFCSEGMYKKKKSGWVSTDTFFVCLWQRCEVISVHCPWWLRSVKGSAKKQVSLGLSLLGWGYPFIASLLSVQKFGVLGSACMVRLHVFRLI